MTVKNGRSKLLSLHPTRARDVSSLLDDLDRWLVEKIKHDAKLKTYWRDCGDSYFAGQHEGRAWAWREIYQYLFGHQEAWEVELRRHEQ